MAHAFKSSRSLNQYSGGEPTLPPEVEAALEIREVKRTWPGSRSDVDIREECDRIRRRYGLTPRESYGITEGA